MKILAVIPARYDSSRLPGKPLADIHGKPMIQWVYEAVISSSSIHTAIVATDDERILNSVKAFGGNAEMTSKSHANGTSRCAEVAERHSNFDFVLNVQGDEPLLIGNHLDRIVSILNDKTQIASAYRLLTDDKSIKDPSVVKVVLNKHNEALYFSRSVVPYNRDSANVQYYGHVGIYAFKRAILTALCELNPSPLEQAENLEQLRWLENDYTIQMVLIDEPAPAVDTPEGLELVRELMLKKLNQ